MRRILLPALLFTLLLLSGCTSSGTEYKTDVLSADIAAKIDAALQDDSLVAMEDSYLVNAMQLEQSDFAEYVVKINSKGINIDEYGIFKAPDDKSVEDVKAAVENYLKFRLESWMPEYMPEELPKLESASVKVCGRYVMYAILSDERREVAFNEFENALK